MSIPSLDQFLSQPPVPPSLDEFLKSSPPSPQPSLLQRVGQAAQDLSPLSLANPVSPASLARGAYRLGSAGARTIFGLINKPAQLTEHWITGGKGWETWLTEKNPSLPQGLRFRNPQEIRFAAGALGVIADPTNLLLFPGEISTGLKIADRAGMAVRNLGEATGISRPIAQAAGVMEKALLENRLTKPVIEHAVAIAHGAQETVAQIFNVTHNLPASVREAIITRNGQRQLAAIQAISTKQKWMKAIQTEGDATLLSHALEGTVKVEDLPTHLHGVFTEVQATRDALTREALESGVLSQARNRYITHLFPEAERAKVVDLVLNPIVRQGTEKVPGFTYQRTFDTLAQAKMVGLHPIEDVRSLLAHHELAVREAQADAGLLNSLKKLGPEWVRSEPVPGWAPVSTMIAGAKDPKISMIARLGLQDLHLEPRLAGAIQTVLGQRGPWPLLAMLGRAQAPIKQLVFYQPLFHGANVIRSAFLADGLRIFSPRYFGEWKAAVSDAYEGGPLTRRFLEAGGSIGASAARELRSAYEAVLQSPHTTSVLEDLRSVGTNLLKGRLRPALSNLGAASDEVLWNQLDRGMRLTTFKHLAENGATDQEAARLTNVFMNNYSKDLYTKHERELAATMFTYSWMKGRVVLFRDMAKSLIPGKLGDVATEKAMQSAVARWAASHLVTHTLTRMALGKVMSGASGLVPLGQSQGPIGRATPVYAKPLGFYDDIYDMVNDPVTFAKSRANPFLRPVLDAGKTVDDARRSGEPPLLAAAKALAQEAVASVTPAGLGQLFARGERPLLARVLPTVGVPVTSRNPAQDPRHDVWDAMVSGDYGRAISIIRMNRMGVDPFLQNLPPEERMKFLRLYRMVGR